MNEIIIFLKSNDNFLMTVCSFAFTWFFLCWEEKKATIDDNSALNKILNNAYKVSSADKENIKKLELLLQKSTDKYNEAISAYDKRNPFNIRNRAVETQSIISDMMYGKETENFRHFLTKNFRKIAKEELERRKEQETPEHIWCLGICKPKV